MLGLAAFAGGAIAGAAIEEVVYRRALGGRDRGARDVLGSFAGRPLRVESFDSTTLYAQTYGSPEAPTIVFAHGFTLTHEVWHHQLRDLADDGRFHLVAYDARGHGGSGPARGPDGKTDYDPRTLARDLFAVVHAVGLRPAVVVGHSMGGMTVQSFLEYATEFEEDVGPHLKGLVLVNTTFTASLGAWSSKRSKLLKLRERLVPVAAFVGGKPELIDRLRMRTNDLVMLATRMGFGARPDPADVAFVRRMMEAARTDTIGAAITGLASFDALEGLERIDVPVLIVAGGRDIVTPPYLAREMTRRIPGAELVVYDDVGHMAMLERPEDVSELIRTFAERVLLQGAGVADRRTTGS